MIYIQDAISKSKNIANHDGNKVDKVYFKKGDKRLSVFQRIQMIALFSKFTNYISKIKMWAYQVKPC